MILRTSAMALGAALLLGLTPATAQNAGGPTTAAPGPSTAAPNDYSKPETWLCRPENLGACGVDLTTTVVAANGKTTREAYRAAQNPKIDCFYVYPTVSHDLTPNSDMQAGPEERSVVEAQFARFGAQCRLFAPLYRQVTLTALRAGMTGKPMPVDRALGYNDVKAAWDYYLAHDNKGRGVVLIGHSQGSGVLTQLIKQEIDGKPIQARIVSALLLGTNLQVPVGKDVGGDFKSMPLCRSKTQTGCALAYASFRSNAPPPANSRFAKGRDGMAAACVNPAAPAGGEAVLHSYWSNRVNDVTGDSAPPQAWVKGAAAITTPYVSTPGLVAGKCVSDASGSYLAIEVRPSPGPRTQDITGDVITNGVVQKDWGLHLIDANVAMGDLVALVGSQAQAYAAKR
jgi:hypothetical protein